MACIIRIMSFNTGSQSRRINLEIVVVGLVFLASLGGVSAVLYGPVEGSDCRTEGERQSVSGRCLRYYECKNNSWVKYDCELFYCFNNETMKCDSHLYKKVKEEPVQCQNEKITYRDKTSCRVYYTCRDGYFEKHNCPWFSVFDPSTNKCSFGLFCSVQYNETAHYAIPCSKEGDITIDPGKCLGYRLCSNGYQVSTSCSLKKPFDYVTKTCDDSASCLVIPPGQKVCNLADDCKTYFYIKDGEIIQDSCAWFRKFDQVKRTCVWKWDSSSKSSTSTSIAVAPRQKRAVAAAPNPPVCSNYVVKPSNDCRKFFKCTDGQFVETECPMMQYFDYPSLSCRFSGHAICAPQSCIVGEKKGVLDDCKSYKECEKQGETAAFQRKTCSFWRKFDSVTKTCAWFDVVCTTVQTKNSSEAICKEGETRGTAQSTNFDICFQGKWLNRTCTNDLVYTPKVNGCSCVEDSRKALANYTKYYQECSNGQWVVNKCILDGTFDSNQLVCKKDGRYRRSVNLATNCTSGQISWSDSPGVCSSYKVCNDKGEFEVKDCPDGKKFNGEKCSKADACSFEPVPGHCDQFKDGDSVGTCEFGNRFDDKTRECVHYALATCSKQVCTGVQKRNHPFDCSKYLECQNGEYVEKNCGWWSNSYDWTQEKCVRSAKNCRYDPSVCTDGEVEGLATDCSKYIECKDNSWRSKSCGVGRKFDAKTKSCKVFFTASCSKGDDINSIQLYNYCDNEGDVRKVNGTCRLYDHCSGGIWERKKCSPCQNFQEAEKICDWVWKNPCSNDVTDPPLSTTPGTISPTTSASVTTAAITTAAPKTAAPTTAAPPTTAPPTTTSPTTAAPATAGTTQIPTTTCKAGSRRALVEDCESYLECDASGSEWIKKKCEKMLFTQKRFDSRSLTCVYFNYKCLSDTTTTVAPTTAAPTAAPTTAAPTAAPTTPAPTAAPTTPAPTTAPTTPAPTTAPTTPAPTTAPTTPAPTAAPTTAAPTAAPTTPAPTTAPTTPAPTAAPTTAAPTAAPTTPAPTTAPTTPAPTAAPTTAAPTAAPTTPAPTAAPTTAAPTAAPTTAAPTAAPTTPAPTAAPTTPAPSTPAPTSAAPITTAASTKAPTLCTPKAKVGIAGDCKRYKECDERGEQWVVKKCSKLAFVQRKFDSKKLECVLRGAKCL